ncbi:beta-lactamase/transpeptidase-like protein [Byssothecium circinans]|uniref:Beta-lactamase/transpeptidase-like protein n=1 Tax=Byssothecium circinans TaxID=147558 RepID=A0A6A5UBK0_9PLEO|nr:beta-lactamase/transpeptidase-like protein [Byssothecium circinans]
MATAFEKRLNELQEAGTLPGGVFVATDASGDFNYTHSLGVSTTSPTANPKPAFTPNTRLVIASCTKLFTAIAVLKAVETGKLSLDEDLRHTVLPELDALQIIESVDQSTGALVMKPNDHPITLRHLLTHTSGLGYDLADPPLLAWHAQNGTTPWTGPTVPARMAVPLQFTPGSGWRYGVGTDWAGLAVERACGQELEDFLRDHVWEKLGIKKATFRRERLREEQSAAGRVEDGEWAEESMLVPPQGAVGSVAGAAPGVAANSDVLPVAVPLRGFSMLGGLTKASGGGGLSCTAAEYLSLLKAVLTKDQTVLSEKSWDELLAPQVGRDRPVGKEAWEALNKILREDDIADVNCGMNLPREVAKSFSLAGLVSEDTFEATEGVKISKGTVLWGGMTGMAWFVDRETGLCGLAAPQVFAFGQRPIHDLNALWLRQIFKWYNEHKNGTVSA